MATKTRNKMELTAAPPMSSAVRTKKATAPTVTMSEQSGMIASVPTNTRLSPNGDVRTNVRLTTTGSVSAIAATLQALQRNRAITIKSRVMTANRLQALVAGASGYSASLPEKERRKAFAEATKTIKDIDANINTDHPLTAIVKATLIGINALQSQQLLFEKEMTKAAKKLPILSWVQHPHRRGFGIMFLAVVVGETGDLSNYANPAKVWRRMGCSPWTFDDKTFMGATWRSGKEGKLPASEWESFGYSPRRRSIAYLIGEGIVKQNVLKTLGDDNDDSDDKNFVRADGTNEDAIDDVDKDVDKSVGAVMNHRTNDVVESNEWMSGETHENGRVVSESTDSTFTDRRTVVPGPYRKVYDDHKASAVATHSDWSPLRCHRHGMLIATKWLLRDLWRNWNGFPDRQRTRDENAVDAEVVDVVV